MSTTTTTTTPGGGGGREETPNLSFAVETVAVEKASPYTFDLGLLTAFDPNPLPLPPTTTTTTVEDTLASIARDGAQALINQLLTTRPITSTSDGVILDLPPPSTPLPREKPVPVAKPPTKWERFAAKKGIRPKTREQRKNLQFNEDTGDWERRWGFKGANKSAAEKDWVVEVDPAEDDRRIEKGTTARGDGRRERRENVKRNERKMRKNMRAAAK